MKSPSIRDEMNRIYRELSPEEIPWNNEAPPQALAELAESGKIKPCKAIDLGCGAGNTAIYLSSKGFDVTAVDISSEAIEIAKANAKKKGSQAKFLVADLVGDLSSITGTFDFAYDWDVLHHVFPAERKKYIENVCRILHSGSRYLSVCFHEKDPQFGGSGKYRKTRIGTLLYFSSKAELRRLFEPHFRILELKTMEIEGKSGSHLVNYAFMEKR